MDDLRQKELEQQLEVERQKLTEEQREKHDRFCALLKANETYSTQFAIEGAQAIYALDGTQKLGHELRHLADRADQQGLIDQRKAFADADKAKKTPDAEKTEPAPPEPTNKPQQDEDARQQQLVTNAKELGGKEKGDVEAAAWVRQAESLDRQRHQHGRYDFDDPGRPSGGGGARAPVQPQPPNSPTPGKDALSANEVFQRFGSPELMARYNMQEQRREDAAKSSLQTPEGAARAAERGITTSEARQAERIAAYSPAALKKKADEAQAARANDPTQTQGRGRGGRGR